MSYNIKVSRKKQTKSNIIIYIILVFFTIALASNLFKLAKQYVDRNALLSKQTTELQKIKEENNKLLLRLKQAQTEEFVEKKARELTFSKQNEYLIIADFPTPTPKPQITEPPKKPNYLLWLETFSLK